MQRPRGGSLLGMFNRSKEGSVVGIETGKGGLIWSQRADWAGLWRVL